MTSRPSIRVPAALAARLSDDLKQKYQTFDFREWERGPYVAYTMQGTRPGTILVSDAALAQLDTEALEVKRLRRFRAKGAPRDLDVCAVAPRSDP